MAKKIFIDVVTCALIILFIYTGLTKAMERTTFLMQIAKSPFITNYAMPISWIIPYGEILTALLLSYPGTRKFGFYLSFTLMILFTEYIAGMMLYSDYLPCSCGGVISKMSWNTHLVFNATITFLTVIAIAIESGLKLKRLIRQVKST